MKSTSARKACSAKTAYRGTLSRRQREDLRQAARLARTCGAGFILYGILVVPPGDAHRGRKIPERIDDEKKKMSVPDVRESESKETSDEARATTSKRQQKSVLAAVSLSFETEMDPTPTTPDIGAQRAEDGPSSKKKEETKKSDK